MKVAKWSLKSLNLLSSLFLANLLFKPDSETVLHLQTSLIMFSGIKLMKVFFLTLMNFSGNL